MKPDSSDSVLELLPLQILRLRAGAGVTISCDSGTFWVPQEGVTRDDFLAAGESLCITSAGVTLAEAVGGAVARLTLRACHTPNRAIRTFHALTAF